MERTALVVEDEKSPLGAWEILANTCPLLPHTQALGQKPVACAAGIQTNMQGAIPMKSCRWLEKDSAKNENGVFTINCLHGEA